MMEPKTIRTVDAEKFVGETVKIYGWVEDKRILGNIMFLTLKDGYGKIQVTIKKTGDASIYNRALATQRQSVVYVIGKVSKYENVLELIPEKYFLVSQAHHPLPIDPTGRTPASLPNLIEYRPLSLRIDRVNAVFRIRGLVKKLIREYFYGIGAVEVDTPKIIAAASEGGAELFKVEYFDEQAYLAQSPQLYKEQLTMGLTYVFEIAQFYRAEKSHTRKHLTEFTSVDFEGAYIDYNGAMDVLEGLVKHVLKGLAEEGRRYYEVLGREPPKPVESIPRIRYDDLYEYVRSRGKMIKWGDDFDSEALSIIAEKYRGFYFIIDWPWDTKPFYIYRVGDYTQSFDLMYNEMELASGGTREHRYSELRKGIIDKDLNIKSFEYHVRYYKYGMPPHAGFGLGLDRFVQILVGAENIREVVLYPRDPERLIP